MFLEYKNGEVVLREKDDFSSFRIVIVAPRTEGDRVETVFAGLVSFDRSRGWVSAKALKALAAPLTPEWLRAFDAMSAYAAGKGWVDPATGAIRAHVAWVEEDQPLPSPAEDLRRDFKLAMRRMAATVTIITTQENGKPYGMTATAVTSLSADPPAIVVCVNRSASISTPLLRMRSFCLNMLDAHHRRLSAAFSGEVQGADRFRLGDWRLQPDRPPFLADAQANLFCAVSDVLHSGTHDVILGAVTSVATAAGVTPLLHLNTQYGQFLPEPA